MKLKYKCAESLITEINISFVQLNYTESILNGSDSGKLQIKLLVFLGCVHHLLF